MLYQKVNSRGDITFLKTLKMKKRTHYYENYEKDINTSRIQNAEYKPAVTMRENKLIKV